jgi:hypothetical protein
MLRSTVATAFQTAKGREDCHLDLGAGLVGVGTSSVFCSTADFVGGRLEAVRMGSSSLLLDRSIIHGTNEEIGFCQIVGFGFTMVSVCSANYDVFFEILKATHPHPPLDVTIKGDSDLVLEVLVMRHATIPWEYMREHW